MKRWILDKHHLFFFGGVKIWCSTTFKLNTVMKDPITATPYFGAIFSCKTSPKIFLFTVYERWTNSLCTNLIHTKETYMLLTLEHNGHAFLRLFVNLSFCIFLIVVSFLGQNYCPQNWSLFTNLKRNWVILNLSPQIVTHIQKIVFIYIFLSSVSTKGTNFMEIHFMERHLPL